jgi:protein-disulfide isomerase
MLRAPSASPWLALLSLVASCASPPAPSSAPGGASADAAPAASLAADHAAAPGVTACFVEGVDVPLIAGRDPSLGNPAAPVTLVLFGDLQDPGVARTAPALLQLMDEFGAARLRLVWKHEPHASHPEAQAAAEAAQGALELGGQEAFWRFFAVSLDEQQKLGRAAYLRWGKDAGIADMRAFERGLNERRFAPKLAVDHALAARFGLAAGDVLVNGTAIGVSPPIETLRAAVEAALADAAQAGEGPDVSCGAMRRALADRKPGQPPTAPPPPDRSIWGIDPGASPARGPRHAQVTIIEFSDFQCPYCKRVEGTLAEVRAAYGDRVRIVWKDNPLSGHRRAMPAAELAREALARKGEAGFWAAHDALFASAPKLDDDALAAVAAEIGLDPAATASAISSKKHRRDIEEDIDLADDFKASGTPYFFINGRKLVGSQPLEKFRVVIDEELARAQALLDSGTPLKALYPALVKDGKPPAPPERKTVGPPPSSAPSRGNPRARVVIQEFSDFQCPYCRRVEPAIKDIMKKYGGKVRLVFRQLPLPFHPDAQLAAEASLEVAAQKGDAGFWKMSELLFAGQKQPEGLKRPALEAYAAQLGLDLVRFNAALDKHTHLPTIEADAKAAEEAKINGTPSFMINDIFITGAYPFAKFRKLVDLALSEAAARKLAPPLGSNLRARCPAGPRADSLRHHVWPGPPHRRFHVRQRLQGRARAAREQRASRVRGRAGEHRQAARAQGRVARPRARRREPSPVHRRGPRRRQDQLALPRRCPGCRHRHGQRPAVRRDGTPRGRGSRDGPAQIRSEAPPGLLGRAALAAAPRPRRRPFRRRRPRRAHPLGHLPRQAGAR